MRNPSRLLYNFPPAGETRRSRSFSLFLAKRRVMKPARRNFCALILIASIGAFLSVPSAAAHAILLESDPALKSAVPGPDVPIKLRFNVRIDTLRSRLTLIHPDGSAQTLEISKQTPANTLSAEATGLSAATHRPPWPVLLPGGRMNRRAARVQGRHR